MIFYALPVSSYSAKVRIVLIAKNIAFHELEPPGGYRSEAYRGIVPMGTLPAINDEGFVLSESEAINEYLEECYPAPQMLPRMPRDRAAARFLSRFHDLYLEPPVRALFAHIAPAQRDPAIVEARATDIRRRIAQLARLCNPRPYLAADYLTLADCGPAVTVPLAQTLLAALGQPLGLPEAIAEWHAAVQIHPSVREALDPWRAATERWVAERLGASTGNPPHE